MNDRFQLADRPILRNALAALLAAVLAVLGLNAFPPAPPAPPAPAPAPPDAPIKPVPPIDPPTQQPDPLAAIVKISRPGVGCSATVIGPKRPDGRWWVLTAAHCTDKLGERWSMRFRDGRTGGFTITNIDKRADCAWGVTDANNVDLPFALVAEKSPAVGTRVWHAGYGVDIPANREDGQLLATPDGNDQLRFRLSVSSGDSGGGMVIDADGRIVSCVCCTRAPGQTTDVWGASVEAIRRTQRDGVDVEQWVPLDIPIRMP